MSDPPRRETAETGRSVGVSPVAAGFLRNARVLVVDDRDANVRLLEAILRTAGVDEVVGLTDPRRAVERCVEFGPDVVLLDLHMAHMDGLEVLASLRRAMPDDVFLPVVVLTADATPEARQRVLAGGANDFLTKPFDRVEVLLRVSNLLETRALYMRLRQDRVALQRELDTRRSRELRLEDQRRRATERIDRAMQPDGFQIAFQPLVDLGDDTVAGFEALARFAGPPHRSPDQWFAEAAELGRGTDLELLAIERSLSHFPSLPNGTHLALNVSPETARDPRLYECVSAAPCDRIVLELTEHDKIRDYESLRVSLERFRARGVHLAVDDAGAGYAGLQHILSLKPDVIKLDLMLTRGVDRDPARRALANCLVQFANEIGAAVVAEGIETAAELET
ncbi:MAG: hypothetical protein QOH10_69, partial [Actinomycetota bacterium]|nr:hypothetical protein [Actinomycetota bacterium]